MVEFVRRPAVAGVVALAAVGWAVMLATAAVARGASGGPRLLADVVYAVGDRVCHQRPERSFSTGGHAWPVCARCTGLYVGGAVGALAAFGRTRGRRRGTARRPGAERFRRPLLVAAAPTACAWALEWVGGWPVSNAARWGAAVPLGLVIGWLIAQALAGEIE
jgi:hypothetical protein